MHHWLLKYTFISTRPSIRRNIVLAVPGGWWVSFCQPLAKAVGDVAAMRTRSAESRAVRFIVSTPGGWVRGAGNLPERSDAANPLLRVGEGKPALDQLRVSAEQRPDACDPAPLEEQRRTSGGHLVGTAAVEDDVAVARDLVVAIGDLLGAHPQGAGDRARVGLEFDGGAQVDDNERGARIEQPLQLVGRDAGHAQLGEDPAAPVPAPAREQREQPDDERRHPAADAVGDRERRPDLRREAAAEREEAAAPEQRADRVPGVEAD